MDDESKGCLGCAGLLLGLPLLVAVITISKLAYHDIKDSYNVRSQEKARQEETRHSLEIENKRIAEAKSRQETKEAKIRTFALQDAPKVWAVYQSLRSEIDMQSGKIEDLRKSLVAFDRLPEQDEDFKRLCALRDEMERSRIALYTKLEDAYIAACKFSATPGRTEYERLHKKALEDGMREAEAAESKFKEMRLSK